MNLIIGAVVVIACVFGGFMLHGGKLLAIWQPSELLIIGGAAIGGFLIANPMNVVKRRRARTSASSRCSSMITMSWNLSRTICA